MSAAERTAATEWPRADAAELYLQMRARREVATSDLFLPEEGRLRDDDRATIAALLRAIVDGIEQALRERLALSFADRPMLAESLASRRIPIARPLLEQTGALRDPALVAALAYRAEEARLTARLRLARDRSAALEPEPVISPVSELADHADPAVARAAGRLLRAGHDGRGAAGVPVPGAAELPAEVQHRLAWRCAAALRDYSVMSRAVPAEQVDLAIAQAVAAVLAGYDEGDTPAELALALARAVHRAGVLDDMLLARSLAAGDVALFCAGLATRAGLGFAPAWEMIGEPARLLLLCRAAGVAAAVAADCAVRLARGEADDAAIADRIDAYAALPPERAGASLALWRLDPAYRDAIADLAGAAR